MTLRHRPFKKLALEFNNREHAERVSNKGESMTTTETLTTKARKPKRKRSELLPLYKAAAKLMRVEGLSQGQAAEKVGGITQSMLSRYLKTKKLKRKRPVRRMKRAYTKADAVAKKATGPTWDTKGGSFEELVAEVKRCKSAYETAKSKLIAYVSEEGGGL